MPRLSLSLLGRFNALLDSQPIDGFRTSKVQALLVYLVAEPQAQKREHLMELLWPGMPTRSARHNLRQVLYYLRRAIPELRTVGDGKEANVSPVTANRQTIRLNPHADVAADIYRFQTLTGRAQEHAHVNLLVCGACRHDLEEAVALYRGDFLVDFYLDDSNEFEEWAQVRREAFRRQVLDALEVLAAMAIRQEDYPEARSLAERQLEIDNLREGSYRQLMEALALSGHREQALAVYDACRRILAEELSMAPTRRTTAIYEKIQSGDLRFDTARTHGVRGYEIMEEIGSGAHGTIHRAIQPPIGREVAVKVIRRRYANNPEFIRRFEEEMQTIARLEHPYVVPLYDYWRDPDGAYLAMRFIKGGSLLAALRDGPWDLEPATQLLDQVGSALATAHQMGIVHRDIKPANILLDGAGNAYLSDFGIAKTEGRGPLTPEGDLLGTPDYISPEQILAEGVSPQSDIYSLGAVMYEVLTGEKPFGEVTIANLLHRHLHDPIPLVSSSRDDLPPQTDTVLQKATKKRPEERYASVIDMIADFRSALTSANGSAAAQPVALPTGLEVYNPYKGLMAFQEADADDFFGRDALVERLVARLTPPPGHPFSRTATTPESRFLALIGPSGSGKSSAIKAGLLPVLRQGAVPGSEKWFFAEMVPGTHPLEELEMALWPIAVDPPPSLVAPMERDIRGMLRTLRRVLPDEQGAQLLLFIDQFEELFTLVDDEERRLFFLDSLLAAISAPRSPLRVVITLRADFYDRPLLYESLGQLLQRTTEIVLPMTAEELTWAIREPARRVGVALEHGLAEAIVADVADQPGALPLLQYALTELFAQRQGMQMSVATYDKIGRVRGALGRRAAEVYETLNIDGQEAARQLFLRLVTLGEGVEDTRRRVLRSDLEALGVQSEGERVDGDEGSASSPQKQHQIMSGVIDRFGGAWLLTFDRDPEDRRPTVEIAHEALLREWGLLRAWLDEHRADIRLQQQLSRAAIDWHEAGQDDSYLLRGARLAQFETWDEAGNIALTNDERALLVASVAARETRLAQEEARRDRELFTAQKLAQSEKERADAEARRAEEQAEGALRQRRRALMLAGALGLALVLAILATFFGQASRENANLAATREAEALANAALASTREREALENGDLAATREAEAQDSALLAAEAAAAEATAASAALEQKALADEERLVAEEQARFAQSRELAAASVSTLNIDRELGLLLAFQAMEVERTSEAEQALHIALITSRLRQRLADHETPLQRVVYSPDGSLIAAAAHGEGLATVSEADGGQKRFDIPVAGNFWGIHFSDDSRRLAAVQPGDTFNLAVWDVESGDKIEELALPLAMEDVVFYTMTSDWSQAAISFQGGSASVWDVRAGERLFDLPGHSGLVELEYSQDGSRLVSAEFGGLVISWDPLTGAELDRFETTPGINDHAVSPDGRSAAFGLNYGGRSEIQIWSIGQPSTGSDRSPALTIGGHSNAIFMVAFSPDGRYLASSSRDGTVRIYDLDTSDTVHVLPHGRFVRSLAFHPDGDRLLTGDLSGAARVWDLSPQGAAERLTLMAHDANIKSLALSPDGQMLATASFDMTGKVWDLTASEPLQILDNHADRLMSIDFHPGGEQVATSSTDGSARIWDTATGEQLLSLERHGEGIVGGLFPGVLYVDYSPEGQLLVTAGADGTARVWDGASGEELLLLGGYPEGLTSAIFSPDGRTIATGSDGPNVTVRLWDAETGEEQLTIPRADEERIWSMDFSPDGRFLATSGGDTTAKLWALDERMSEAELLATLEAHTNTVLSVRFSHDGRLLATGTADEFRLWELAGLYDSQSDEIASQRMVLPYDGFSLAFSNDDGELFTGSADGMLRTFTLEVNALLDLAQNRLTRWFSESECQQYLHTDKCPAPPA